MHGDDTIAFRPDRAARGFTMIEMLVVIGIIVLLASLVLAVSGSVARASEERATRNTLEVLNAATEEFERALDRRVTYQSTTVTTGGVTFSQDPPALRYDVGTSPGVPAGTQTNTGTQLTAAQWNQLSAPFGSTAAAGLPGYSTLPFRRSAALIALLTSSAASASILQKLPESSFRGVRLTNGGTSTLRHAVDSWDTPIIAIFPGRTASSNGVADPSANVDKDGTIKCDSEWGSVTSAGGLGISCKDRRILWVSAGNDARFNDPPAGSVYKPSADNLYSYEP